MRRGGNRGGAIARILNLQRSDVAPAAENSKRNLLSQDQIDCESARELLNLVLSRIATRNGYFRLAGLGSFFAIYIITLISQQDVEDSFSVESSVIMSDIMASLPANGQGGFFNAGGPGATGMLTSSNQLLQWLSQTIVPALFQDAVCGDGQCNADEQPALGRFGCMKDCGSVPNSEIVNVDITFQTAVQQYFGGEIKPDSDPAFKYNIYSKVYNDFIFKDLVSPSNVSFKAQFLRNDELELRLYQTRSLVQEITPSQVQINLACLASSIPPRKADTDYSYGDANEMLSIAASQLASVQSYCWNCGPRGCHSRYTSDACSNPSFEPTSSAISLADSYGLSGTILYSYVNPATGKADSISLLPQDMYNIPYCGVFKYNRQLFSQGTGIYFDTFPMMLTALKEAEVDCGSRRKLPQATRSPSKFLNPTENKMTIKNGGDKALAMSSAKTSGIKSSHDSHRRGGHELLNPLGLGLSAVGVDDGSGWMCYDHEDQCMYSDGVSWIDYNDTSQERFALYRYSGPVYVAVDVSNPSSLDVRFSVDGSNPSCSDQEVVQCSFPFMDGFAVQTARSVKYGGKTRIVIHGTTDAAPRTQGWADNSLQDDIWTLPTCSVLQVWICSHQSTPQNRSILNITDSLINTNKFEYTQSIFDTSEATLGPLVPGPIVQANFLVSKKLNKVDLRSLQLHLCSVIWNVSQEEETCEWQIWVSIAAGANVEVWSDTYLQWVASSNGFTSNDAVWTLSVTILAESNSLAARARIRLTEEINDRAFVASFNVVSMVNVSASGEDENPALYNFKQYFAHVTAPTPVQTRKSDSKYGCLTHYECDPGLFCSWFALKTWNDAKVYVGMGAGCDDCRTCFDSNMYPLDRACPEDKCGPRVGTFPKCWDASKLLSNVSCPDKYPLNLSVISAANEHGSEVPFTLTKPTTVRARFLTPFNRLIGAVIIRQKRIQGPDMNTNSSICSLFNDSLSKYSSMADPSRGLICLGTQRDSTPFGTDPMFASFSDLYDGRVNPFEYYNASEFASLISQNPFGFFPHRYDHKTGKDKVHTLYQNEADNFLVFLDERISSSHAQKIVTYLTDGNFIDQQTREITVEMNTLNAANKLFCKFRFTFTWQLGGGILWDFHISSVPIYVYDTVESNIRKGLEYFCILMLSLNALIEVSDILISIRQFNILQYVMSASNVLDWCHFSLMFSGWILWFAHVDRTSTFSMSQGYNLLSSPDDQTQARILLTNADEELRFLTFSENLSTLEQGLRIYTNVTSLCVILFVLRLLKALDFQPRMALVTRTISSAFSDLFHFIALFTIIFLGYVVAGYLLFGHQFQSFSNLGYSAQFLVLILLSFDPTQMWVQMEHASPTSFIFSIFIWTWVFLAFFVLLNIFLAILIEGYTVVKKGAEDSCGMPQELGAIAIHEMRRISAHIWDDVTFISDDELAQQLAKFLYNSPMTVNRAFQDYAGVALGNCMQVRLKSGIRMETVAVRKLLQGLPLATRLCQVENTKIKDGEHSVERSNLANIFLDAALIDLMGRYGTLNDMFNNSTQYSSIEGGSRPSSDQSDPLIQSASAAAIQIRLRLEQARGIGRVDVRSGADLFCVAFIGDWSSRVGVAPAAGNRLFQTKIIRGKSEWSWNEEFIWTLTAPPDNRKDERRIVIMVYDKDQFSADDVVGCVELSLERARREPLSCWETIVRPRLPVNESPLIRLWRRMGGPQPTAELKFFLSSEAAVGSEEILAVAEAESAEVVKSPARLAGASCVEDFDRIVQVGRLESRQD